MKIGELFFILLVELRNGFWINKELKFLFVWVFYYMKGCLEMWYYDVKLIWLFFLNLWKLLCICDWLESFGSFLGCWMKI